MVGLNRLTNILLSKAKFVKIACLLLFLVSYSPLFAQTSVEDTKKQANNYFEEEEYNLAYKLYAQLVSNFSKDIELNYRLGVCMIYSEPDKKKCLPYLKFAAASGEAPKEAKFYLGKAYHINYLFDEAIKAYNDYKKIGSSSNQKKLQVDREIKACGNGKRLLSNLSDLEVQSKKELNEADYFRTYDLKSIGGKLLVKPDDFKTGADKRKKDKSVVYVPRKGDRVYFSSYGDNTDNGRDIFYKTRLPNGTYSQAVKVKGINTEFDEDYPFLHPNGKTLYFASKGFNSMGGYDIFKSTYNEGSDSWSMPENLEFPINSPDDDYLFVTDSLEKIAFFSTGRQSMPGKIDVLKVKTERKPIDLMVLKGTVLKENPDQSLLSKILIKNIDNGAELGTFNAEDNGDYLLDLPNGAKLLFTVETPGLKTQSQGISLPMVQTSRPFKQAISYEKGILKIINYFEEAPSEDSYLQYLKLIENKAKLDVNSGKNNLTSTNNGVPVNTNTNTATVANKNGGTSTNASNSNTNTTSGNTIATATKTNSTTNSNTVSASGAGLNNKELSTLAKKDAEESKKEAEQFTSDANDALELGETKKIEAEKKIANANEELKKIESITNEEEKNKATQNAIAIKNEGEKELEAATKIITYANNLKEDAGNKIKEADLNNQYANELEKVINSKNPSKESLTKLESLQKEIEKVSAIKNKSENFIGDAKNEQEEKEKEITAIETNISVGKQNLNEINNEIKTTEEELSKAKKKNKAEIQTKLDELKADKIEKEKQIATNENKLSILKGDLAGINNQLEMANKIKNETISTKPSTVAIASTNSTNTSGTAIAKDGVSPTVEKNTVTLYSVQNKYQYKVNTIDINNKTSINENTTAFKNYNKEIDAAIAKNKIELGKAKSSNDKTFISDNIKLLEETKSNNQQQIIANNKALIELNNNTAVTSNSTTPSNTASITLIQVSATDSKGAINELDKLNNGLNYNDSKNFEYNNYQSASAKELKNQADAKVEEVNGIQNKLKETIASAKNELAKNNSSANSTVSDKTPNELNKDAEDLTNLSIEKLDAAKTKEGEEKKKLLKESDDLQKQSNEKSLQASIVIASDNKSIYQTNNENIDALLKDDKATEADKTLAKTLNDEAKLAFTQAKAMREEANSQTNIGAKLGGYTNAEEKEAEGLAKQKKAVDLLKNANVNFTLKEPLTSVTAKNKTSGANNGATDNANTSKEQIANVNKSLTDLLVAKKDAYTKLSDANQTEAQSLIETISTNQTVLNNNPALKSEFVTANTKLENAKTQKQNAYNATNESEKVNNLINATKKEIEAINALNKLNAKLVAQASKNAIASNNGSQGTKSNLGSNDNNGSANNNGGNNGSQGTKGNSGSSDNNGSANNNVGNNGSQGTKGNTGSNDNNGSVTNNGGNNDTQGTKGNSGSTDNNGSTTNNDGNNGTKGTKGNSGSTDNNGSITNNGGNNGTQGTKVNDNNLGSAINTPTIPLIDVKEVAKNDTTATQALSYAKTNAVMFTNQGAKATISNALADIEATQKDITNLSNTPNEVANNNTSNPEELKTKANDLISKADELSVKAFDLKTEANSKQGEEKQKLLDEAEKLETDAMNKKMEASVFSEQSIKIVTTTNNQAIGDMLKSLKTDNPDLANVLEQKNNDIATLAKQVVALREEANAIPNGKAKLGALSNVEEKELELIQKQSNLINELKKTYPNYVMPANVGVSTTNANLTPEQKQQKQTELVTKQNTALVNLVNGYSLEYEAQKVNTPQNLDENQKTVKQNADDLNSEAKRLLIQSIQAPNETEKNKMLAKAAKLNSAALLQLSSLNKQKNNKGTTNGGIATNVGNNPKNNNATNGGTNPRNNNPANSNAGAGTNPRNNNPTNNGNNAGNNPRNNGGTTNNVAANPRNNGGAAQVKVEGLEVIRGNAYNETKPIPMNAPIPDGLVFRVQIGAFKVALPNNAFKGLNPLNGETTPNGYIRYTAGNFNKLENANAVKNDLRNLGYNDAFVVVYYNGKRILLNEALAILEREGKTVDYNVPQSAGITANANVPRANTVVTPPPTIAPNDAIVVTKELEKTKNLLYTVQIGVYSRQISWKQLLDLKPIYTEKLSNGLFRYTAGIYNNGEKVILDKRRTAEFGIDKPFVSAYLNGKRVDFNEYRNKQATDSTIIMEQENPIIFPSNAPPPVVTTNSVAVNTNTTEPFKNNVTSYPEATPENGVKADQTGVCFKVQIGAYSKQVPNDVAAKFSAIQNWPIENKLINGLYIYNVGNFVNAKSAKTLRDEVVKLGIFDAFISVYKDGVKLFGSERQKLMEEN